MVQDHVHMLSRIPPKYSIAEVIGYLKGKSAIARQFGGRKRNFNGEKFWARGYAVSTVGFEETEVKKYILSSAIPRCISCPLMIFYSLCGFALWVLSMFRRICIGEWSITVMRHQTCNGSFLMKFSF